ncbi:gulonolactone oxidase Lgo1 [Mycena galericulata]|nr:gulonolactone oxidase Lgo1 [Mycena galericulata]
MPRDMHTDSDPDPPTLDRRALVDKLTPIADPQPFFINWGRTFQCTPHAIFMPNSTYECRLALELARRDGRVLRPVGVGHSPSDVACTRDYMISMTRMNRVLHVDVDACHVVAEAGITLTDLHAALAPHGLAMRNLGSISDQTLAGIVTTCTHGSGVNFGVLSTYVKALTLLRPDNTVVACSPTQNVDLFKATICGLGATGLILTITLELEPAFRLKDEHTMLTFPEVLRDLDTLKASGEHVRLWWFPAIGRVRASVANRTTEPACPKASWLWDSLIGFHFLQVLLLLTRFARASPAPSDSISPPPPPSRLLLIFSLFARLFSNANVLAARLACWLAGPKSVTVDESWRVFNIDTANTRQEWAIPSTRAGACLAELEAWLSAEQKREGGERPHFPIEVRWSAADDLWLSPSSGGETCWIGIVQFNAATYKTHRTTSQRATACSSPRSSASSPRTADGRIGRRRTTSTPGATRALYPDFGRFLQVVEDVDPDGVFRNEYIERHLMGGEGDGREYKLRRLPVSVPPDEGEGTALTETSSAKPRSSARTWAWLWRAAPQDDWHSDWRLAPPEELNMSEGARTPATHKGDSDSEAGRDVSPSPSEQEGSASDTDETFAGSVASLDGSRSKAPELVAETQKPPARILGLGRPEN